MFTAVFWKKAWTWIKHHWYFPVIIVLMALLFFARTKAADKLFDLMSRQRENYKKEIDLLKEVSDDRKEETEKILEGHKEALQEIEKSHEIKIKELEAEKREEVAEVVEEFKGRPADLAREIAKILSAEYLKKKNKEEE
jgi:flagellar biosynthesis/type III secretory pathway M-ring protein FliF/YscJ